MTHRTAGGVAFQAPWASMYWVNLKSHIASRVLWEVGHSTYRSEEDVYRAAYALAWPDWFMPSNTIKVKVSAHRCPLPSLDFVTLRIKDAVCDKFMTVRRKRPSVDRHHPNIRLDTFLDSETVTFYLDTSGEPLFKQQARLRVPPGPLKEAVDQGSDVKPRTAYDKRDAAPHKDFPHQMPGLISELSGAARKVRLNHFLARLPNSSRPIRPSRSKSPWLMNTGLSILAAFRPPPSPRVPASSPASDSPASSGRTMTAGIGRRFTRSTSMGN